MNNSCPDSKSKKKRTVAVCVDLEGLAFLAALDGLSGSAGRGTGLEAGAVAVLSSAEGLLESF
jgi:hypothetical protein